MLNYAKSIISYIVTNVLFKQQDHKMSPSEIGADKNF